MASQSGTGSGALASTSTDTEGQAMIKTLAQSGKHSATLEFFDVHSHCSVLK